MTVHPPVEWAQRNDKLFVTVFVEETNHPTFAITDDKLTVKADGHDKQNFECEIEFYKPVKSTECKKNVSGRFLSFVIPKQETGPYWPRLLKSDKKVHWLKVDFGKWKDEDEEDEDIDTDMGFGDMMNMNMNNVNPYNDFDGEEDDYEEPEEDLPDEEDNSTNQKPKDINSSNDHEPVVETAS